MLTFNNFTTGGGGGGGISGTGTPPYIPIWTAPTTLGDSKLFESSANQLRSDVYQSLYLKSFDTNDFGSYYQVDYDYTIPFGINSVANLYLSNNAGNTQTGFFGWNLGYNHTQGFTNSCSLNFESANGGANIANFYINTNGISWLKYEYFNRKTYLYNGFDLQQVPLNESSFNLYQGGSKYYGFGSFATTGGNLFFGNQWNDAEYWFASQYQFNSDNVCGGLFSNNIIKYTGSVFTELLQPLNGFRAWSCFTAQTSFRLFGTGGNITHVAGIQVLGLNLLLNQGGSSVSINNYYGLLINDSNEYGVSSNIGVGNRYGIYQVGLGDTNVFRGLNSFVGNIGFFSVTPQVQQNTSSSSSTVVHNVGGTNIKTVDTFDGYTIAQVVKALRTYGLLA